jgi:hypothetical protein
MMLVSAGATQRRAVRAPRIPRSGAVPAATMTNTARKALLQFTPSRRANR